jgi:uncharacterized membrane protein
MIIVDFLFRWLHVLFGLVWIGMLYYFNFVQTEYFKEAEAGAKADALKKLAPRALWWFRWGAMATFITGLYLYGTLRASANAYVAMGALAGTLMFLNVWLVIWPRQKIICGLVEGDAAAAAPKAALASRTNTLLSGPMLMGMLGSKHGYVPGSESINAIATSGISLGLIISLIILLLLEANALVGKPGPIASVKGVIHMSVLLTVVLFLVLNYL